MENLKDENLTGTTKTAKTAKTANIVAATNQSTARGNSLPYIQYPDGNIATFENPNEFIGRSIIPDDAIITRCPKMVMNPNKDIVDAIIKRLFLNDMKCPCQSADSIEDTRCPCGDFYKGNCHCSLFIQDLNQK